jgi:hypothetical protein
MGAGIAVVVALVGLLMFMLVRQRAMAQAAAERDAAEAARQQAEEALGPGGRVIADPRQPRWEYRVVSVAGNDDAVNQAISKLTDERWEYVGVIPPAPAPDRPFARMLFKRIRQGR